eukprot:scaffold242178_cov36-Tisochrysis_lutea.AAC.3
MMIPRIAASPRTCCTQRARLHMHALLSTPHTIASDSAPSPPECPARLRGKTARMQAATPRLCRVTQPESARAAVAMSLAPQADESFRPFRAEQGHWGGSTGQWHVLAARLTDEEISGRVPPMQQLMGGRSKSNGVYSASSSLTERSMLGTQRSCGLSLTHEFRPLQTRAGAFAKLQLAVHADAHVCAVETQHVAQRHGGRSLVLSAFKSGIGRRVAPCKARYVSPTLQMGWTDQPVAS